jgi:hypothetical protein
VGRISLKVPLSSVKKKISEEERKNVEREKPREKNS